MELIREDCIYARQSVDRKDSISIESQIDFCKYELKGGSCRVFKDKGYSGKNTDRPEFQKLLGEIRKGKVRRVIVYKLDRISRSILDFATMMELFQEYDVEFVSSTEKFDTSTPMGRAMLNICIVFAQLERETIQKRVTDAYYSRCLKGFHMSGQAPYGYQLEPTVVEGIRTKKMVADPIAADHVRLMFEMYAEPETSFGDITRYFEEHDIKIYGKSMFRTFLSQLLRNPVYAQADLELYEFFKSQGAAIVNDASDFAGTNGCYLYQGRDVKEDKDRCLKDQILVIAPHEALISSDTWLKCRKKLMANTTFQQGRKPKNTWLAGKIKCGHCGYALKATHVPNSTGYFRCTKRTENKGCPGCGKIRKEEFEQFIFSAMQEKFKDFQILHGREEKVNPKLTAYQVELAQVEAEIEKLLDTLTGANATLLAYANKKIEELDTRRQTISKAIAELSVETISPQQIKKLGGTIIMVIRVQTAFGVNASVFLVCLRPATMIIQLRSAIGTEHKSRQRIGFPCGVGTFYGFAYLLCKLPGFLANDCLVCVFKYRPFLRRAFDRLLVLVGFFIGTEVYGMPHIFGLRQDIGNGCPAPVKATVGVVIVLSCPLSTHTHIVGGTFNPCIPQYIGNLGSPFAVHTQMEDFPYNGCRFFINQPMVLVVRVFLVAV